MKKTAIGLCLFACTACTASADTINLKDGRTIETQQVWEENGMIKYYRYGSEIGIQKDQVLSVSTQTETERRNILEERKQTDDLLQADYPSDYEDQIRLYLKLALFDYDSVKDLSISKPVITTATNLGRVWTVMTIYNAKNRYGAYTGIKQHRFYFRQGKLYQ